MDIGMVRPGRSAVTYKRLRMPGKNMTVAEVVIETQIAVPQKVAQINDLINCQSAIGRIAMLKQNRMHTGLNGHMQE